MVSSAAPTTAPSGSLAVPLAVPAQALTVGNAGEPQAAKPVEEKVDGTWLQHDVQAGETLYSIFRNAVITSGGVSVREVDPKTMQSKKALGLYFAGEVLDVDAYTGGYNLQIAFCTAQSFANHL